MALDFPDAPATALAWLAELNIVRPSKYEPVATRMMTTHLEEVVRAASIFEYSTIRSHQAQNALLGSDQGALVQLLLKPTDGALTDTAKDMLLRYRHREEARHGLSSLRLMMQLLKPQGLIKKNYVSQFLANAAALAPYTTLAIKDRGCWNVIGAAMVVRCVRDTGLPSYASESDATASHKVAEALAESGICVTAATLHKHTGIGYPEHLRALKGQRELLKALGFAPPAQAGDPLHQLACAFADTSVEESKKNVQDSCS